MSTHTTLGHMRRAVWRNSSSGPVNSWLASDTNTTASAMGSAPMVAAPWAEPSPPTPGVSTITRPSASSLRGSDTSTELTRRSPEGSDASVTWRATWSMSISSRIGSRSGSEASPPGSNSTAAAGGSPKRMAVGTAVAMSSSTGHTGALSRAFTRDDLPCLNSPITNTWKAGSARRLRVTARRVDRSGRAYAFVACRPRSTTDNACRTVADRPPALGFPAICATPCAAQR